MAKIELPVTRDFGQLIGDPILFFRQNFKLIGQSFLYFTVPMLLVASAFTAFGLKGLFSNVFNRYSTYSSPVGASASLISLGYFAFVLIYVFQQAYLSQYMVLYSQNKETTGADTRAALLKNWKTIVLTYVALFPLTLIAFATSFGLVFLSAAVGKYLAGLLLFIIYLAFFYVSIALSNLIMVRLREGLGILDSIAKCFFIISGKWWRTFGGLLFLGVVFYSFVILAAIPFYIAVAFLAFNKLLNAGFLQSSFGPALVGIYVTALVFWMFFLFQIFHIYIGVNYFSLSEAYDDFDLRRQIMQIGETEEARFDKQEGEY
jgi:hypothetical protein